MRVRAERGTRRRGWWRAWGVTAAIVGTLGAVLAAATETWMARQAEDELVRDSLRRYADFAARAFGDGLQRAFADLTQHGLTPAHGAAAWRHDAPLPLEALVRHLQALPHAPRLAGDSGLAVFRIDVRPGSPRNVEFRAVGPRADTARLRELLALRVPGFEAQMRFNSPLGGMTPMPDGTVVAIDAGWQFDDRRRPVALVGIAGDGRHRLQGAATAVYRNVSLLPPALAGGPRPASPRGGWAAAGNERRVAVRVRSGPHTLYTTPNWARSPFRGSPFRSTQRVGAQYGFLEVDAALDPGARDVLQDTRARGASRALIAGVLALAGMSAVVALVGVRRQHQLARARELFVAAISHELRTPLTQIRLASETLLLDPARSTDHTRRWARVIDREALRLGELVENALVYARAQRHDIHVAPRPLELAPLVANAADAVRPLVEARGARVDVDVPAGLRARADEWALRHVLFNLLDNAVKYGPQGQTVRIVAAAGPAGTVDVSVLDQGPGVQPADRDRVWTPFVRVDEHDGGGGTGLGLAVVRTLVERQGGTVRVDDAPGGGARFTARLPAA